MNKLFTLLLLGLTCVFTAKAQDDFPLQFAYSDGTIIPDGTVLTLDEAEEDIFGDVQVPSGLFVKNTSESEVRGGAAYVIRSISSGIFQTCFPSNCIQQTRPGEYTTQSDAIAAGELKNMQTEWFPGGDEGTAIITYQLLTFKQNVITKKWNKDKEGPAITLSFAYGTGDGIASVRDENGRVRDESYMDMLGRTARMPRQGLYIKRTVLSDGTVVTRKVIAK